MTKQQIGKEVLNYGIRIADMEEVVLNMRTMLVMYNSHLYYIVKENGEFTQVKKYRMVHDY